MLKPVGKGLMKKSLFTQMQKYHPTNHLLIITQENSAFAVEKSGAGHLTFKAS